MCAVYFLGIDFVEDIRQYEVIKIASAEERKTSLARIAEASVMRINKTRSAFHAEPVWLFCCSLNPNRIRIELNIHRNENVKREEPEANLVLDCGYRLQFFCLHDSRRKLCDCCESESLVHRYHTQI